MVDEAIDLTKRTLHSKDRANMWLGIGLIISLAFNGVALYQNRNDARNDRARVDDIAAANARAEVDRADNQVAVCVQYNVTIDGARQALIGIVRLARPLTPQQDEALNNFFAAKLPFRDCSPAGIKAYYDNPPPDPGAK